MKAIETLLPPQLTAVLLILLVLFNTFARLHDNEGSSLTDIGTADPISQLGYAVVAAKQNSLSPLKFSYSNISGRLYYPLGFYWYAYQIFKRFKYIEKYIPLHSPTLSKLFNQKDKTLDKYLVFLRILSTVLFPALSEVALICTFLFVGNNHLLPSFGIFCSVIILDSLFERSYYSVSARNSGLFIFTLLACLFFGFISVYSHFEQTAGADASFLSLIGALFVFMLVPLIYFIIQTSQRYAQCFVSLCISLVTFLPEARYPVAISSFISIFILMNTPYADFIPYIKTHFYNRLHDNVWSLRTYGWWRYGAFRKMNTHELSEFIKCSFLYKYVIQNFKFSSFYKKNFIAFLFTFRILLCALLTCIISIIQNHSLEFIYLNIFTLSIIVPSILCFFRPFQGYGSSEVYVFGGLPFIVFALTLDAPKFITFLPSSIGILFTCFLLAELFFIVVAYAFKVKNDILNILKTEILGSDVFKSIPEVSSNKDVFKLVDILSVLSKKSNSVTPIKIVGHGTHLQTIPEMCELLLLNSSGKPAYECGFRFLDNKEYGYQDDWSSGHFLSFKTIFHKIKPDVLLLDLTKLQSSQLFNYLVKSKSQTSTFVRSGMLILCIINKNILKSKQS